MCVCSVWCQLFTFLLAGVRGLEVRKFPRLLGTEGNPLPQLVCVSACKIVQLLKGESNSKKPSGLLAVIFTAAVLKIGIMGPERQNWAD